MYIEPSAKYNSLTNGLINLPSLIDKRASSKSLLLIWASAKRAQRFTSSGFNEIANLANANPSFNCPKYKSGYAFFPIYDTFIFKKFLEGK